MLIWLIDACPGILHACYMHALRNRYLCCKTVTGLFPRLLLRLERLLTRVRAA